jgi:hypothetical protein
MPNEAIENFLVLEIFRWVAFFSFPRDSATGCSRHLAPVKLVPLSLSPLAATLIAKSRSSAERSQLWIVLPLCKSSKSEE